MFDKSEIDSLRTSPRTSSSKCIRNTILLRIPRSEFDSIEPHLQYAPLALGTFLLRENELVDTLYFMNSGIASLIIETQDGRSVEVGVSGREDLIGLPVVAGLNQLAHHVVVQVAGDAFRVDANVLKRLLPESAELHRILTLRLAIRSMQMAQNTACNRLHNIKQRLARWLLATRDRLDSRVVATTHDFLARTVGTDRPSVSVALSALQQIGAITGSRGSISIDDPRKLHLQSCECYEILEQFNPELGLA
jgi:CRP-like cAMP-binding protein